MLSNYDHEIACQWSHEISNAASCVNLLHIALKEFTKLLIIVNRLPNKE